MTRRPNPDHQPPASLELWRHLQLVGHMLRHGVRSVFDGYELTPPQWRVLHLLAEGGPRGLTPGQISEGLVHTHGNTTGILDKLEELGLARREAHPEDRRALLVRLTDQGRELHETVSPAFRARVAELLGCLSPAEQEDLTAALRRISAHVRETLGETPACPDHPGRCRATERNP